MFASILLLLAVLALAAWCCYLHIVLGRMIDVLASIVHMISNNQTSIDNLEGRLETVEDQIRTQGNWIGTIEDHAEKANTEAIKSSNYCAYVRTLMEKAERIQKAAKHAPKEGEKHA